LFIQDSYIKASDPNNYIEVISGAEGEQLYEDLVRYLQMSRKKIREPFIESELLFAFAKTDRLAELEEFVLNPNLAQVIYDRLIKWSLNISFFFIKKKRCLMHLMIYDIP
jgi:hypothetical protein